MSVGIMLAGLAGGAAMTGLTAMLGAEVGLLVLAYVGGGMLAMTVVSARALKEATLR